MLVTNAFSRASYNTLAIEQETATLKASLISSRIIDEFFNTLGFAKYPPLKETETKRLTDWLKKTIPFTFGDLTIEAPIHEALFILINAASKESFSKEMRIKFAGSFMLAILGKSYLSRLFAHNGVEIKEESFNESDFNKILRDIDLRVFLPNANKASRDILRETLIQAMTSFVAKYARKPEREVEPKVRAHMRAETNPNIADGKTSYLRTAIGSKELTLDIQWIESLGREKLFEDDDISLEVILALFANPDKTPEMTPETASRSLKPFVDILFNLISVFDPSTVNKRGWAKLLLKELKRKKVLRESDAITLFNNAFDVFVKGTKKTAALFASRFAELIAFCHKEHTFHDFASHFLLSLQGILDLIYFRERKNLICPYDEKDFEAIKKELLSLKPEREGILPLLFSYLHDEEMTIDILLDLLTFYGQSFGLTFNCLNATFHLDLKGRIPKNLALAANFLIKKLAHGALSEAEVNLAIAVNRMIPKDELKEAILFNAAPYLKKDDHPVCDIPVSVFTEMRERLEIRTPAEAIARALFSHPSTFGYGLKWLERHRDIHYLRASFAVLAFGLDPNRGLKVVHALFPHLKPLERKQVIQVVLAKLNKGKIDAKGIEILVKEAPDPELTYVEHKNLCALYPELIGVLIPRERFCREAGFLSLIKGAPNELDDYFKTFSPDNLKWLIGNAAASSPELLSCIRILDQKGVIEAPLALHLVFTLKINFGELPEPIYDRIMGNIIESLSKQARLVELSHSRMLEVAKNYPRAQEFILAILEGGIALSHPLFCDLIERLLTLPLHEAALRRAWPFALSSRHRGAFLFMAAKVPSLEKEAATALGAANIDIKRAIEEIYRQIEEKNWSLACSLITRFHARLPLDEIMPVLMTRINRVSFLYLQAQALFELFQEPALKSYKLQYAGLLYRKLKEAASELIDIQVYSDIKANFSLDEVIAKNLAGNLLYAIKQRSCEEIKAERPYLIALFKKIADFTPFRHHLDLFAKRELAESDIGMEFFSLLSPHSSLIRELETTLLIESDSDTHFLTGMKRRNYARFPFECAQRLYRIDPAGCFDAIETKLIPTLSELETLFDLFIQPPLNPLFIELLLKGYFNGLKRSPTKNERFERFLSLIDPENGLRLAASALFKAYLEERGYPHLLRWRSDILQSKKTAAYHLFPLGAFNDEDRLPILTAQYMDREDLRASVCLEVNKLSSETKHLFFKRMFKKIRSSQPHALPFFNSFIKASGFIKHPDILDLVVFIALLHPDQFEESLNLFMGEKIHSLIPNLRNITFHCDKVHVSPLEWYQTSEDPVALVPYMEPALPEQNIPPHITKAFFDVLGQVFSKFCISAVSLHATPEKAAYLLDFVAHNLYLRSENIGGTESLKKALEKFLRPVVCDIKKYHLHMNNLKLIQTSQESGKFIKVEHDMISNHIYIGTPLFRESLLYAYPALKEIIHSLIFEFSKEAVFAPSSFLHALNLMKIYDIDLFTEMQHTRKDLCHKIFAAILNYPHLLKIEEINFSVILKSFLPKHEILSDYEYEQYWDLIGYIRSNCPLLFKRAEIEYLPEALTFYSHLLEHGFVRNDAHFQTLMTGIVNSVDEVLREDTSEAAFKGYCAKFNKLLFLDFENKKGLGPLCETFKQGVVMPCLKKLAESKKERARVLADALGNEKAE